MGIITAEWDNKVRCKCGRTIHLKAQEKESGMSALWAEYDNGKELPKIEEPKTTGLTIPLKVKRSKPMQTMASMLAARKKRNLDKGKVIQS